MEKDKDNKLIATRLPLATYNQIERYAKKQGIPMSNILRLALMEFFANRDIALKLEDMYLGSWGDSSRFDKEGEESSEDVRPLAATGF